MYLFIDSTYDLYLGILDQKFNWLSFEIHGGQKASGVLQPKVYEILNRHKIFPADLSGIFSVNGPGFYTGLRLAEGFSDVFSFFGVKQYSFYTYEIPFWCGHEKGTWFTRAYRGEYFFFNWNGEAASSKLVRGTDLNSSFFDGDIFIHSNQSLDQLSEKLIDKPIHTVELIRSRPNEIFTKARKTLVKDPFYFRAPEDEFKVNP
jgi:tRNA threonylcarbamoyladenosine biosynthesis protein TsaB